MNFNNNPILYPKKDELNPTKDDGLNPPCYPKEDGLNPFKAIVERINALESVTRNYGDSFETKQLTVSENAQIENLHSTEGTVDTLNSTNCNIKNAQIENLRTNKLTWDLSNIDVINAETINLHATEGTVDTLESTNATVTNLNSTNATVDILNSTTSTVTNGNIKNAEVENLNATKEIKVENLKIEEPILSNAVVGYDENGKMIPIKITASLYFDYTVDSQQKFDNLLSILKSGTPNTYRSIAIIGGLGDGEHGEYLYTIDSNSSDANLNNASLIGLNNPKIIITANNANTFKVFKNGLIKDIDFNVGGTVTATETVSLFHNCTYDNGNIALNNTSANFNIVDTILSNVINNECKIFTNCTLNDCTNNAETKFTSCNLNNILINYACTFTSSTLKDCKNTKYSTFVECSLNFCTTVQSVFNKCNSEMLYVSTDTNIANKYSFNKCGIHLDMKKSDMTQVETVTINISSMTDTKLSVLDSSSNLKKIVLNVDASDTLSEIIGNNDKKYSIYEPFVKKVYKSVSPSMRSKAYLSIYDESHTPIFSNDGVTFYIDEAMTQQVGCYNTDNAEYSILHFFMLKNESPKRAYSSLAFNEELTWVQYSSESSFGALKLSDYADEFILNGNSLKTYILRNDESGTLLYSNDNGSNVYISPDVNNNKVQYIKTDDNKYLFMLGDGISYSKTLRAFNKKPIVNRFIRSSNILLEVTPLKNNYAVQVVSNYNVPIYVENAFSTKIKNT